MPKRALLVTRLSVLTDVTTSPQRQKEITESAAKLKGFEIVGTADDLDVSASKVAPMDRKALGHWLKHRVDDFDVIVFWRLDRFVRKVSDLATMIQWCDQHGKDLVSATEQFELTSPMGRAMAYLIGVFAEMESNAIKERVTSFKAFARTQRRWGGGTVPFGYRLVDNPAEGEGGVVAVEDTTAAEVVREIFTRIADGEAARRIAGDLIGRGVASPQDYGRATRKARTKTGRDRTSVGNDDEAKREPKLWSVYTISRMVKSAWPLGRKEHKGKVVRDSSGEPVEFGPALVSFELWQEANSVMKTNARPKKRHHGTLMLSGIVRCAGCGLPMAGAHYPSSGGGGRILSYYRCTSRARRVECDAKLIRAEKLDAAFEEAFLTEFGSVEIMDREWKEGSDTAARLAEITARLTELRGDRTAGLYSSKDDTAWYRQQVTALQDERDRLTTDPGLQESRWIETPSGTAYGRAWADADKDERRKLLMDNHFTGQAWADPFTLTITHTPPDTGPGQ